MMLFSRPEEGFGPPGYHYEVQSAKFNGPDLKNNASKQHFKGMLSYCQELIQLFPRITQTFGGNFMSTATVEVGDQPTPESLLKAYAEICNSYRAIDDFRMKLLGFLPFASVAGVLLLSKEIPSAQSKLVGYACFFASVFTFSLFLYEIRGMLRSGGLIRRGKRIDRAVTRAWAILPM